MEGREMDMVGFLSQLNTETEVLLTLSIILFSGFILTRMTNTLNMPKVSGYILAGILIGPCCLNFIPAAMIEGMSFVSDLALAFIAFGVGKFFKKEVLMRTGKRIIVITLSEALAAGVLVTVVLELVFRLDWEFALILGAIATATAPASTMMTINQYKARGEFVDTLLQIVALDDVVCLLAFSIVSAIINGNEAGGFSAHDILLPIAYNLLVIVLGVFCGYFLSRLLIPTRSKDNRLILAIAMLLGLSGICAAIDISPLLSCMVFGAVYINLTSDKKLFRQINSFTPPVMSIFFIVSGMNLDIGALRTVGAIGVGYFLVRIIGKYMGTYVSCMFMKTSREIRNFMGLALIPQAGVAIGLAFLGQRMLPPETGSMMLTIILSSSVLYEMVGPVSAKAALLLSGSIPYGKKEDNKEAGGEDSISGIDGRPEDAAVMEETAEEALVEDTAELPGGAVEETAEEVLAEDTAELPGGATEETAEEALAENTAELMGGAVEGTAEEVLVEDIEKMPEEAAEETAEEVPAESTAEMTERAAEKTQAEPAEGTAETRMGMAEEALEFRLEESRTKEVAADKAEGGTEQELRKTEAQRSDKSRKKEEPRKKAKNRKGAAPQGKAKKDPEKKEGKRKTDQKAEPETSSEAPDGKQSSGSGTEARHRETDGMAGTEAWEEEEELHAVLPELREYSKEAEEGDVYDIEKEVKPPKPGKKKKGKKEAAKPKAQKEAPRQVLKMYGEKGVPIKSNGQEKDRT